MNKYEIRNLKTFQGMDTPGYNCTLYRDGRKVANVINDGSGGETRVEWLDYGAPKVHVVVANRPGMDGFGMYKGTPEEALLQEHVKDMVYPKSDREKPEDPPLSMGMDGYIEELVNEYELRRKLARQCKKQTCFRTKDQERGKYWEIKAPFTKALKQYIVGKYGDSLEVIYNEELGQEAK